MCHFRLCKQTGINSNVDFRRPTLRCCFTARYKRRQFECLTPRPECEALGSAIGTLVRGPSAALPRLIELSREGVC